MELKKYESKSGKGAKCVLRVGQIGKGERKSASGFWESSYNSVLRVGRKGNCECKNASEFWAKGERKDMSSISFGREEILCRRSWRREDGSRLLSANVLLGKGT